MQNKTILLVSNEVSDRVKRLLPIIEKHYTVALPKHRAEAFEFFDEHFDNLIAVIFDNPSKLVHFEDTLEFIKTRTDSLTSVPVIILTDSENRKADVEYLDNIAISIIDDVDSEKVILHRIERSYVAVNSMGFQEFSRMLTALPSLIYVKDEKGRYVFCSQSWHHIYKHAEEGKSVRGLTDFDIRKDKKNAQIAYENDMKVIKTGVGMNYLIKEEDEEGIDYLRVIKEPLKRRDGSVKGVIALINNVTEEEQLRQELRLKSITDQLTGLYNRVYFEEISNKIDSDSSLYPITMISGDCDNLKRINDKFGHFFGDLYINMTANLLKETLPDDSLIFRMGGDEFVCIVPHCNVSKANALIKKIDKNMKTYKSENFVLEVSFGSHTLKNNSESLDKCVIASDRAMYRNKRKREKKK